MSLQQCRRNYNLRHYHNITTNESQTTEFKDDTNTLNHTYAPATYLLNSNKIVKIGKRKHTNSETQLLPTSIAPIKEGNESPSISPSFRSISPSTSTISSSNPEEKAILINESWTDDGIHDHNEFDRLLFSSNSNVKLQSILSINKYFEDRKQNSKDEYKEKYISFYKLHCLLQHIAENKPNSENEFIHLLDKEWMAYQTFAEQTISKLSQCYVSKNAMLKILKFNQFIGINQEFLNDLILKHDRISKDSNMLAKIWDWKLKYHPQTSLFPKIKEISNLYSFERCHQINENNKISAETFERLNIKYWLRQSDIFQVIAIIIQHLPIYIFNSKTEESNQSINQQISSVYLDNDEFKCYHERIQKQNGAKCVRIRWYGKDTPNQCDVVYIERKIHRCGRPSLKDRFKIKNNEIISFINNESVNVKSKKRKKNNLQTEVNEMIKLFSLNPKTRTVYKRIAFQFEDTNSLRMSLDLDLKFVKENNDLFENNLWYTTLDNIYNEQVVEFPLCVLEIKLSEKYANNPPKWVQDLMESKLLMKCYKFSKFGESVNQFYQNKVHIIPRWRRQSSLNPIKNNKKFGNKNEMVLINVQQNQNVGDDIQTKKLKQVNPKVYFSNERTFLGWFQAAVFIGSAGLTICSINKNDIAGPLLISVAGLVLLWAVFIYYKRNLKLLKGSMEGLHDCYGPAFLVSVIIFVFTYSLLREKTL